MNVRARSYIAFWIDSSMAVTAPVSPSSGAKDLPALPGMSRRARTTERFSTSRGPISMRSGTPRISQSLNLKLGVAPVDRHHDDLERGEAGRHDQPLVIAVHHDDRADESGGEPPRRRPAVLQLVTLIEILDVEGLGEVLAEVVRCAGLQRP